MRWCSVGDILSDAQVYAFGSVRIDWQKVMRRNAGVTRMTLSGCLALGKRQSILL